MRRVYLDNAATTPISEEVIEVMTHCLREHYGNPSSIHAQGRAVRAQIEEARKKIAGYLGASIGEIFFTSGGTESNNMALRCAVKDLGVERIISSPTEHHCVGHTLEALANQGVEIQMIDVCNKGKLDYEGLETLIKSSDKKTLVSLMHANNEIGTLQDMNRVSKMCVENGVYYHSDTVQTIGHFPINVSELKINFLSGSAHKFHGPKGVGFIYVNNDSLIKPLIHGGAQERNMRAGTENVYGIVGMAKALELACENMKAKQEKIESVRAYLKNKLIENFEDIQFNGDHEGNYLYTVLSVSFPNSPKSEMLLLMLDINGISASGGSACSSGAEKGSHVMNAVKADPKRKSIRFSFSHYNTKEEIDFVIEKLKTMVAVKKEVLVNA